MPATVHYPQLADGNWLRRRYIDQHAGLLGIAAQVGCSEASVRNALARHEIPVRPAGRRPILADLTAERALDLVRDHGLMGAARELGVNIATLHKRMGDLGVHRRAAQVAAARPARQQGPAILYDKAALADLYRRHTASEIARTYDCYVGAVTRALRGFGIPVRPTGTAPPDRPLALNPDLIAGPGERKCLNPPCKHRAAARGLCRRCMGRYDDGHLPGVTLLPRYENRRDPARARCTEPGCLRYAHRNGRCSKHPLPRAEVSRAARAARDRDQEAFQQANASRIVTAAVETVEAARRALASTTDAETVEILTARVENPRASLAELALATGLTKDAYAARLRRALAKHRPAVALREVTG